ncbi:MAG: DnaJ domain-containing protein [Pyrinomonadaceae bacterium]|nr:DnaJ domain-containing protein [Pyrinomonadaceae bacterium]
MRQFPPQTDPRPIPHSGPMTQQNTLEFKGTISAIPLGELIVEIGQTRLSGSLRVSRDPQRAIIYFEEGRPVYCVSNARQHRLFGKLVERKLVDTARINGNVDPVNDFELSAFLLGQGLITKELLDEAVVAQLESILIDTLSWTEGEWTFTPLARVRQELHQKIDAHRVLLDYARVLPLQIVRERFRSVEEAFSVNEPTGEDLRLLAHEADVEMRFGDLRLTLADLRNACAMPEDALLQALYVLWLGGRLTRHDWTSAFTPAALAAIGSARLAVAKKAAPIPVKAEEPPKPEPEKAADIKISLEEYLERVENAETHYEVLGLASNANVGVIKQTYFGLAKLFHPDRYHKEKAATVKRVQTAFTRLAHAHETLKTREGREAYDIKIRREAEAREKRRAAGQQMGMSGDKQTENAFDSFVQGKEAFANEDYAGAISNLARAVHYQPENPLFKAYFGRALSADDRQRHRAEAELQAAVRMDPKNAEIRMLLVDFFMDFNMAKRAEGELKRFLEIVPGHREATARLSRIGSS